MTEERKKELKKEAEHAGAAKADALRWLGMTVVVGIIIAIIELL